MYQIKQIPEDFIVDEIINIKPQKEGDYSYFILKKRDYTTNDAIQKIADKLKINTKNIGFAGNKDRRAITTQLISFYKVSKEKLENLNLKDIGLKFFGYGKAPISLGELKGNKFKITVKNLSDKEIKSLKNKVKQIILVPNLFGEQRFSNNNAEIGKSIIKKDFKNAVELILKNKGYSEDKVSDAISEKTTDYIGALRKINKKILKLYIHAYQSEIFNKTVEEYKGKPQQKIPVIGFGTELERYNKELQKIIIDMMKKEKITFRDFIIPQIPELSSEGNERDLFTEVKGLSYEIENDDLNKGKNKTILDFSLNKGCYATVVVSYLFD